MYRTVMAFAFTGSSMRTLVCLTAATMMAATAAVAAPAAVKFKGANLALMASVTLAAARASGLAAHPGVITD